MKRHFTLLILLLVLSTLSLSAQFEARGVYKEESPSTGTGLDKIFIFKNLSGSTISYTTSSSHIVNFYQYQNNQSDAVAIPTSDITVSTSGGISVYTISNLQDGRGYLVDDNLQRRGIWIIDYSQHLPQLNNISVDASSDPCSEVIKLLIDKTDQLTYNGVIAGAKGTIKRLYTISYDNLEWDGEQFVEETVLLKDKEIDDDWLVSTPLIDTYFTLSGDQYAEYFGINIEISSSLYQPVIVKGYMVVPDLTNDPMQAPANLSFQGYGNEPVATYYTWTIAKANDENNPIIRYTDQDIDYEFAKSGTYKIVLEVATDRSVCTSRDSVNVIISESYLEIPNFFTPGDSPGYNDEFKVKYQSLVRFKCTIFNRWGNKLYEWSDPEKGWDGKYKGKYVSTGVYYYVIEAEGSDGVRYNKGGDINILRQN